MAGFVDHCGPISKHHVCKQEALHYLLNEGMNEASKHKDIKAELYRAAKPRPATHPAHSPYNEGAGTDAHPEDEDG